MKLRILLIVIFMIGAFVPVPDEHSAPANTHIAIMDYVFDPTEQTITAGDSITWQNDGQELHNVVDIGGAWESQALSNGQTYSFTFTTPGTYTYVCSIHSGMLGTIVVVEPMPPPQKKLYIAIIQR